ncbi:MAG: hypothetical protein EOQ92_18315 [Mesorhizobium sp.]|nr:MAG: hypothetical protein EOQ92_18315 [Mesorhizobium sp.]
MNKNTAGAVLVLIVAATGLMHDNPWACGLAAATCALAFLAEEVREVSTIGAAIIGVGLALASWATITLAAVALLF